MFECEHCHTTYTSKYHFSNHADKCKILLKKIELKSVIGIAAFGYYEKWLTYKKRPTPELSTFFDSNLYVNFINFATFAKEKRLPDTKTYIAFVVKYNIQPGIWCTEIIHSRYIKYLDTLEPMELVDISICSLIKISKILNCPVEDVMLLLNMGEIINLLHSRHLTPWFLLNLTDINVILGNSNITANQHKVLEMFINPDKWNKKLQDNTVKVIEIKKYLKRLKL